MSTATTSGTTDRFFEEYRVGEQHEFPERVITAMDIAEFAELSGDHHPAHTDDDFAGPLFGGRIAHGVLTFAVVVGMTVELNGHAVAYGYDRIRFPSTVLAGERITATSEVIELRDHKRPGIGLVTKRYVGTKSDGSVAVVCEHILAVQKRP
ncbi:MaoC family dehydratase [Herbiconiux sp. A18JL235]|uniref:MaoC family dehydratase n=1 Tax=Herbiconiux sp. A18JL235 TaxID=3152363 RepID=A0AB39BHJ1_9MICO